MKFLIALSFLFFSLTAVCQIPEVFRIPRTGISLQLPNDKWKPSAETDSSQGVFFFKREPIKDTHNRSIIPAIMVFVEDAKKYNEDLILFSTEKQMSLRKRGLDIDTMQIPTDKGCPLTYRNGIFFKGSYTQNGIAHIMYLIYLIDKEKHGIQLYLDMTADLGGQYEEELLATIRSVK